MRQARAQPLDARYIAASQKPACDKASKKRDKEEKQQEGTS